MRVFIAGAGGVGGYFGACLAHRGCDVTFLARSAKAQILRKSGLKVVDQGRPFETRAFKVTDDPSALAQASLIILTVKTYDLQALLESIAAYVPPGCSVLTLQNGVSADLMVKEILPQALAVAGLTQVLASMTEPGVVTQLHHRPIIKFGLRNGEADSRLDAIHATLTGCELQADLSVDIVADIWEKFIWIANFAGMSGSRMSAIGQLVNNPDEFQVWMQGVDEAIALARALKISINSSLREKIQGNLDHYKTSNTEATPSLMRDLQNGRPTEIEALSGTVVRLAKDAGISVPVHESFYRKITATRR